MNLPVILARGLAVLKQLSFKDWMTLLFGISGWFFGFSQLRLRRLERKEKLRADQARQEEERRPPSIFTLAGNQEDILVGGYDTGGRHRWGVVRILNPTQKLVTLSALKLVINGETTELSDSTFYFSDMNAVNRYPTLALVAGQPTERTLHFMFPPRESNEPVTGQGELWLRSDNCPKPFVKTVVFHG